MLGVCGGIAAYKAAELVRLLHRGGAEVEVAMTASAQRFITPLTFASLTARPVYTSLWSPDGERQSAGSFAIEHVTVAQQIDALVVAPTTANTLARFAHGMADDFLSTLYLATTAPVLLAPAMNVNMWNHPATKVNLQTLRERGAQIVEPDAGYLACGMTGSGRLADPEEIAARTFALLSTHQDLAGERILITAGGTREPIDPVRFLGNRSSGKMGHALADAAAARGAHVLLVTASQLPAPQNAEVIRVSTAEEMRDAAVRMLPSATLVLKAAAVADFRVAHTAGSKLRRSGPMHLALEATPDIVAEIVALRKAGTLVIAFAAETEDLLQNALSKMLRKGVDAIVANDVSGSETGFDTEENAGVFLSAERSIALPRMPKRHMADRILDEVALMRIERSAEASHPQAAQ